VTRHDQLTTADLHHPSAMVRHLGVFSRLFAWIFFKPVQFAPRLNNELAAWSRDGTLVYVMNTTSVLDYLYFNYALARANLPLSEFANGVSLTLFQPWRRALVTWFRHRVLHKPAPADVEVMHGHLRRKHAILLFLRKAFSLVDLINPRPDVPWLRELIEAQRDLPTPLLVVPQILVWTRNPDRSSVSIIDAFFGDPEAPGRIRKMVSFLLNHRRAHVQIAEPINLQQFLAEHEGVLDDALLAERLRFRVVQALKTEQRVIRGAPIKPAVQVREEILAEAEVVRDLEHLAKETGKSIEAVRAEADSNLQEIEAKYKMWMVSFLSFGLTLLWARIYEGIEVDEEGLERIREEGRKAPIVIVPSHKSHIDYLIISYIFYRNGLIPPHIAAGANLSFFPLGWIFRRAGAFFLRRSFTGQPVYAHVFRHYVRKLLRDGHWLEFFPEGGRSRTGKLLPPKYGLLRNVLEAVADGVAPDIAFVPANFGYERLIEEKAYRKELEGGEKKAESPVEVLKATSILVHKYGRIRIQFGQPLSARQFLFDHGVLQPAGERNPKAFDRALKVFGYQILGGINAAAVITPTSLISAVLLTKIQRGISRADLLARVGYLLGVAGRRGAVLSDPLVTAIRTRRLQLRDAGTQDAERQAASGVPDPLGAQAERARLMGEAVAPIVDQALALFEKSKWVLCRPFDNDVVYITKASGRLHLDYYKNNMLHLFVADALLAASILAMQEQRPDMPRDELMDETKFLSRLLKFEFVYAPGMSFEEQYGSTLTDFCADGWLTTDEAGHLRLTSTVAPVIRLYAKLIQNFIESYHLMGRAVAQLSKGPMTEAAFMDYVQQEAAHAFELGDVQCYESISKVNLSNALKIFLEQKYVQVSWEAQGKKKQKLLRLDHGEVTGAQLACFVQRITALYAPWRADR
jgi:glycerol-3-phosphate O-acyltransferase